MELQSDDPDFSVSWLLGLRPHRTFGRCPHWAKQFETDDPDFFVSWLLGLRHGGEGSSSGTQFTCPPWLKEFESTDPDFLVSRILGLIPGLPVFTEQAADADAQLEPQGAAEAETSESEEDDDDAEYGLRRLFGDLTEEELAAEASEKTETTEEQPEEAPVLAEPSFLELCEKMEDLLLEIE
jgi:hypothetical protein